MNGGGVEGEGVQAAAAAAVVEAAEQEAAATMMATAAAAAGGDRVQRRRATAAAARDADGGDGAGFSAWDPLDPDDPGSLPIKPLQARYVSFGLPSFAPETCTRWCLRPPASMMRMLLASSTGTNTQEISDLLMS